MIMHQCLQVQVMQIEEGCINSADIGERWGWDSGE